VCGAVEEDGSTKKGRGESWRGRATWGSTGRGESLAVQFNPSKRTMVVEVCCHHPELLIAVKVCYFQQKNLISSLNFYLFIYFLFIFQLIFPVFLLSFFNTIFVLAFHFLWFFFFFLYFLFYFSALFKIMVLYFF
jgi:hypothetical protein